MSLNQLQRAGRIRNSAQASHLSLSQCDPCIVCGRNAKLYPVGPIIVERFGPDCEGVIVSFGAPKRFENFHGFRVCSKHKTHIGESARYTCADSEQFNRFIVVSP